MAIILLMDSDFTIPRDVFWWTTGITVTLFGYIVKQVYNAAKEKSDKGDASMDRIDKAITSINMNITLIKQKTDKIDKIEQDVQSLKRWQGVVNEKLRIVDDEDNNNQ